jgi:glucose dehydrogenase
MTWAKRKLLRVFALGVALAAPLVAQSGKTAADPPGEWHNYNRDLPSSRYSRLSQIDRTNVGRLAFAIP